MKFSYSRVQSFKECPLKFKYRYIDKLESISTPDFNSALVLGSAIHKGIEDGEKAMEKEYLSSFPIVDTKHYNELIKLSYNLKRINAMIPIGGENELMLEDNDFIGFIDYLVENDEGGYDLYDWKYSNNVQNYLDSGQLHLYKYYFEKLYPDKKIDHLYYLFIPKTMVRQRRSEKLSQFRKRMLETLSNKEPQIIEIKYDEKKVLTFLEDCDIINSAIADNNHEYERRENRFCDWCEYKNICSGKEDVMILPKKERVDRKADSKKKIWVYGKPFSGKTYFANGFPDVLMLNTDGNYTRVDAPVVSIKDEVKTEGRLVKRKFAWEVFKEAIEELEKGNHEFKTVVVDLVEDVYDCCRVSVCDARGWTHESDDSFKAYDIIRSEFLRTMKRLVNLDLNVILISHEDSSRDITKRGGSATLIKPSINDKVALKLSGMMDIVCRLENEDGERCLTLKQNENIFGGGRLPIKALSVPATVEAINELYK